PRRIVAPHGAAALLAQICDVRSCAGVVISAAYTALRHPSQIKPPHRSSQFVTTAPCQPPNCGRRFPAISPCPLSMQLREHPPDPGPAQFTIELSSSPPHSRNPASAKPLFS